MDIDETSKSRLAAINSRIKKLKIRFPNAEIVKRMGTDPGNTSSFLKGKKPIPDKFYTSFMEAFPLEDGGHTQETKAEEVQAQYGKVAPSSVDSLIESNRVLAESQKIFAESQKIFAQSQLNFSESNMRVIDTNAVLTEMISSKLTEPGIGGVPVAMLTRLSELLEYVADIGVRAKKWPNREKAISELNTRFYGQIGAKNASHS